MCAFLRSLRAVTRWLSTRRRWASAGLHIHTAAIAATPGGWLHEGRGEHILTTAAGFTRACKSSS